MNDIIKKIEAEQLKAEVPEFNVGDTVKVYAKIKEGNRERIQVFEGTVLKKQGGSTRATFLHEILCFFNICFKNFAMPSQSTTQPSFTKSSGKDSIKKSSTCPFVHNTNLIAEFPISIPKYVFAIYISFLTFYLLTLYR